MCRVLGVSTSGYYAWRERPVVRARARGSAADRRQIRTIHATSRETYGAPRIHAELADDHGDPVGRKRVARLMRRAGLRGASARRFVVDDASRIGPQTAPRSRGAQVLRPTRPDRLWVADITYIPTWAGFLYLAIVLDVSQPHGSSAGRWRRICGPSSSSRRSTWRSRSDSPSGVIHHSDHGCQYTCYAFGKRCREAGVRPSMGSVGDAYDNAMAESFFATLECELLDRRRFRSQAEARMAVFEWIEGWYNPHRRHSALGYRSPMNYERAHKRSSGPIPQAPAASGGRLDLVTQIGGQ